MNVPLVLLANDPEIARLCAEWQQQAEEAVRLGIKMGERLIELERDRDQLRLHLRVAHDRVAELEAELANAHGLLRMASGDLQ